MGAYLQIVSATLFVPLSTHPYPYPYPYSYPYPTARQMVASFTAQIVSRLRACTVLYPA